MRAPIFGLSTMPVMDVKSALRLQLERDMLALVYRDPRQGSASLCSTVHRSKARSLSDHRRLTAPRPTPWRALSPFVVYLRVSR